MTIQRAIVAKTKDDLSNDIGDRIFWLQLPRDVDYPAIRFFRVSEREIATTHDGNYTLVQSRFQFNLYDRSPTPLDALTGRFLAAWLGFKGSPAGVDISNVQKVARGSPTGEFKDEELEIYYEIVDLKIDYKRSY